MLLTVICYLDAKVRSYFFIINNLRTIFGGQNESIGWRMFVARYKAQQHSLCREATPRHALDLEYATMASHTLNMSPAMDPMIGWRNWIGTMYMIKLETE